jgi:hypothetical protein
LLRESLYAIVRATLSLAAPYLPRRITTALASAPTNKSAMNQRNSAFLITVEELPKAISLGFTLGDEESTKPDHLLE